MAIALRGINGFQGSSEGQGVKATISDRLDVAERNGATVAVQVQANHSSKFGARLG